MSSQPSPPAFHDPQAHLVQEIKDLKAKLHKTNENFSYYETSNEELETKVETLTSALDAKETELKGLRDYIDHNNKEYEETSQENEKLRRQSSTFEKIVVANEKELRSVATLESAIEDREAEVRQFTIDLATLKTERDDKSAEVKGLEGDIAELTQELESRDQQIEVLLQKLAVVGQHIGCSPDLAVEELDEVLYEHMEEWTARQGDEPIRSSSTKKSKRASVSLADEFAALSDEEEEDGGYNSDASSMRSVISSKAAKKAKQEFGMSEIESIAIHPSIKPAPKNISSETQTSPASSPKKAETSNTETQTSPTASPKKIFSQVINNGINTSPIAALIQKFTFSDTSSGVQTSPVAASPKTVVPKSFSEVLSKGVQTSPVAATPDALTEVISGGVQTSPVAPTAEKRNSFSEVISGGVQTSPITAIPDTLSDVISGGVQTSPVAPTAEHEKSSEEVISSGVQTSPVASTAPEQTPFAEVISTGVETSPITESLETTTPQPLSEIIPSGAQTSPITPVKDQTPFSEVISTGVQTSPVTPSPIKLTSPQKSFPEVLSSGISTSPITPVPQIAALDATNAAAQTSPTVSSPSSIPLPASPAVKSPLSNEITEDQLDNLPLRLTRPSKLKTLNIKRPRVPTKDMSPATLTHYKSITNPSTIPTSPNTPTTPPADAKQHILTLLSATFHPIYQDWSTKDILLYVLYWFTMYAAGFLGTSAAGSAMEWKWANANGYAPESQYIYVGKSVPGHLVRMVWGVVAWGWNVVFGGWFLGAGTRLPLSPG
jgi:predicted  nucleic acid-binding Zn-ribbon protein